MGSRLKDRVALVTGVGGGIGRACALVFAREGATVVGCDINPKTSQETMELATAEGLALTVINPCDLTKPEEVRRYVQTAGQLHGRIDAVVNAAAIPPHMAKVSDMHYANQWATTMISEVDTVFLMCQEAWPFMLASGKASIINFASVNAFRGSTNFGMAAHCAGKAAVLGLTRQLAIEGGPTIRANTISPGLTMTPATEQAGAMEGKVRDAILNRMPMKRFGRPEDIALCALFLASDDASWITGANFPVDGGVMAT
jgi:NAD(P)-dependent dehydrogenase (short-subunit alcohol dehydrogenase family)